MSDQEPDGDAEWAPPPVESPADTQDDAESQQSLGEFGAETTDGDDGEPQTTDAGSAAHPDNRRKRPEAASSLADFDDADGPRARAELAESLVDRLADVDDLALEMLRLYRRQGIGEPIDVHDAVDGEADRRIAYALNRQLRLAGVLEHVGRGRYRYRLPELVADAAETDLSIEDRAEIVSTVEAELGLGEADG